MSIYSNDNIRKIAKLTTRELPQKSKNAKITVRENNGLYSISTVSTFNTDTTVLKVLKALCIMKLSYIPECCLDVVFQLQMTDYITVDFIS